MLTRKVKVYINMSVESAKIFDSAEYNYDDYFTEELSDQLSNFIKIAGLNIDNLVVDTANRVEKSFNEFIEMENEIYGEEK